MYITCKCLNVSIKTKRSEWRVVPVDDIDLRPIERTDEFFKNNIATINDLENITKEQPGLVEIRNIGAWAIHRCYNCSMYTHAVHREFGAALVLINTDVMTSEEEIKNLKASPAYSTVFRIVVDYSKIDLSELEIPTKFSVSQLSNTLRLALSGLEQQLEEAIQRQANLIDEKIRAFTREQYQILEEFRARAHNEHTVLARVICSENNVINGSANLEIPPVTPETIQPIKPTSANDVVDTTAHLPNKTNALRRNSSSSKKSSPRNVYAVNSRNHYNSHMKGANDYDQEALFMLEGMDDTPQPVRHLQASEQDTDTDDSGNEEVYIPRSQRSGHPTLAKSLPVTVPAFHAFGQRLIQEDDDEQISRDPMDPHNIQASIKALAKSVHGDTVFGDLPRPRFSTQI